MNVMSKPLPQPESCIDGHFDAKLAGLLGDYRKNRGAFNAEAKQPDSEESEERTDRAYNAYWEAIDAMELMPAAGSVGLAAKAEVIRDYLPGSDDAMHPLVLSLASDCIRLGALSDVSNPDETLIQLCDRNVTLEKSLDGAYPGDIPDNCPIMAEINRGLEQIWTMRATTLEGLQARARATVSYAPELCKVGEKPDFAKKLVAALLRDLIGEARA